jgi:hypothetical protein
MQKEKSIALREVEKRGGLCFAGASTDHSCQREAVVPKPWPGEKEIVICEEHALAHGLAHNAEDLFNGLEALHALIHAPQGLTDADTSAASIVFEGLYRLRDDLERRYFDVLVKERGADLVASGAPTGPGGAREFPPNLEAAEALARSNMVVDALNNARAVVEDAPAAFFGRPSERHEIAAVLQAGVEDAASASRSDKERADLGSAGGA